MKATTRSRGAALALVVIFGLVLSILAAAVFGLFQMNTRTYTFVRDRIQARYSAEAGVNLAVDMIMGGESLPADTFPVQFLPEGGTPGYYDLPGDEMGEVMVVVDPNDKNPEISTANAYGVRALARIGGADSTYTYGVETMVVPENFARFATFLNTPPLGGYYGDGYRFDGPFFANGPVCIWSGSVSSSNDIWFYRLSLASAYYYFSTGTASNPTSVPQIGNLTIQPIERMMMGEPYFELNVDPIPFGPDEVNWEDARDAALAGGLFFGPGGLPSLPNGTRLILQGDSLNGDTLWVKTGDASPAVPYYIGDLDNRVVWIDNGPADRLYLKSMPPYSPWSDPISVEGLTQSLTIGCNGHLYIYGPTQIHDRDILDPDNETLLGLIVVHGDFVVAVDPDHTGGADWADPLWRIVTNTDLEEDYVVMCLDGQFVAQNYTYPNPIRDFMIMGGYIVDTEGITGTPTTGWNTVIYYDSRLMTMHPPFFPQTGRFDTGYWEELPELNETTLFINQY